MKYYRLKIVCVSKTAKSPFFVKFIYKIDANGEGVAIPTEEDVYHKFLGKHSIANMGTGAARWFRSNVPAGTTFDRFLTQDIPKLIAANTAKHLVYITLGGELFKVKWKEFEDEEIEVDVNI